MKRMPSVWSPKVGHMTPFPCSKPRTRPICSAPNTNTTCARCAGSWATRTTALAAPADARTLLKASRDEYLAKEGPIPRGRCASANAGDVSCLDHSTPGNADFTTAEAEFRAVLEKTADRPLLESALAHAGLARI